MRWSSSVVANMRFQMTLTTEGSIKHYMYLEIHQQERMLLHTMVGTTFDSRVCVITLEMRLTASLTIDFTRQVVVTLSLKNQKRFLNVKHFVNIDVTGKG